MKNTVYQECREYIKQHHGFSAEELHKTKLYQDYLLFMEAIKKLDRKKVKITFKSQNDWITSQGQKIGRIVVNQDNRPCFFEGRHTRKGQYLDAGLFEGWHTTIIPLEIEVI